VAAGRLVAGAGRRADLLDGILSAEEVGIFKPSPRVYQLALARLGVSPDELGLVSSNSWDVCGAASAGLITFWIQRSPAEPPVPLSRAQW
jgi:2-haloacid dehalogenase